MTEITFVQADGTRTVVEAANGESVMRAAVNAGVQGIAAECGGCLSCGTCHVYVAAEWLARLPPPQADEQAMIDCLIEPTANSRLTCQITVSDALDGLLVTVPKAQF